MPGYPLLAAPFVRLTHANPFLLPDLALLAATIGLAAALAGWMAPGWRWARWRVRRWRLHPCSRRWRSKCG